MRSTHRRVEHAPGNVRDDQLRLVLPNHADDVPSQLQVRREVPILVPEELDLLDPQHLCRCALLAGSDRHQLRILLIRILASLPAISDDDVRDVGAAVGQPRDRPTRTEVRIVRVRRNDEYALELRKPAITASVRQVKKR